MSRFYTTPAVTTEVVAPLPQRIDGSDAATAVAKVVADAVPQKIEEQSQKATTSRIPITQGAHGEHGKFAWSEQEKDADGDSYKLVR